MSSLQLIIQKIWNRQGVLGVCGWLMCIPLSCVFSIIVLGRNLLYKIGVFRVERLPLHIISVGNLSVGGTGKTPFVLWLARTLQAHQHHVGILSRGYKGQNTGITLVGTDGHPLATPEEIGDEAVMLARTFSGVVLAGRDRVQAARLAKESHHIDVLILDDGFQHRRLGRNVDIVLLNAQQRGNTGWVLPAGPFREPSNAIRRADIVILTKGAEPQSPSTSVLQGDLRAPGLSPKTYGRLHFLANPRPATLVQSQAGTWQEQPLALLSHKRVMTVSGVADPSLFRRFVSEAEAEIAEVMEFPDHHVYTQRDWQTITTASREYDYIVTTEKDLVKLEKFPFATDKLVALRIDMVVNDSERLLTYIESQLQAEAK